MMRMCGGSVWRACGAYIFVATLQYAGHVTRSRRQAENVCECARVMQMCGGERVVRKILMPADAA